MRAPARLIPLIVATAILLGGRGVTMWAQQSDAPPSLSLTARATKGSVTKVDPGATVTAVYVVANRGREPLLLSPRIAAPSDWSVVNGTQGFPLAAGETDTWVISVAVPSQTAAGRHVIPLQLTAAPESRAFVRDSLIVDVGERRAIDVKAMDHPAWVMAGKTYVATFLVRNSGNSPSTIHLSARDAQGTRARLDASSMMLSPDSSKLIHATVPTSPDLTEAAEDVLEIAATDAADSSSSASTSVRVTVVPLPGASDQFVTVPAQLSLRAAGPGTGVSPFELAGGGRLNDKNPAQVDFLLRGPTQEQSAFGERDEYRLGIRAPGYQARVGDSFYGYSQLTQAGQEGFGGGGEASLGLLTTGAYAERFRYVPDGGSDAGASVAIRPGGLSSSSQLGVQVVDRVGGTLPGKVVSSNLVMSPGASTHLDAEYAASQSGSGAGSATELLLSGNNFFQYDLSHIAGTTAFAGPAQASRHDYASLATPSWRDLQLDFSGSSHASDEADAEYRLRTMNIGVSSANGSSLSYLVASKHQGIATIADSTIGAGALGLQPAIPSAPGLTPSPLDNTVSADDGVQHGIVGRLQQNFGPNRAWAGTELGSTRLASTGIAKPYQEFEMGNSVDVGINTVGMWAQVYRGMSVTRGPTPQTILGGNANLHLSRSTTLFFVGSGSIGQATSTSFAQIDARLTRSLSTGANISLRARILAGSEIPSASRRLVFLEYSLPVKLPVSALQTPGRVRGRIVNSETGKGVAAALVRLGGQTAITDADGRVWFTGLAPGRYRVSLSQDMTFAGAAVDGDPSVYVGGTSGPPSTFQLTVARAATVEGEVRHWVVARTSLGGGPDSLVDAGPMRGVVVSLTSGRDTLYRATDDSGRFRFTDLPPKHWSVKVVTPPAAHARYEPDALALDLVPGKNSQASFRLVPIRREVHMLDQTGEPVPIDLPAPTSPTTSSPAPAPPQAAAPRSPTATLGHTASSARSAANMLTSSATLVSRPPMSGAGSTRLVARARVTLANASPRPLSAGRLLIHMPVVAARAYKPDDTLARPDDTLVGPDDRLVRPDDTLVRRLALFHSAR